MQTSLERASSLDDEEAHVPWPRSYVSVVILQCDYRTFLHHTFQDTLLRLESDNRLFLVAEHRLTNLALNGKVLKERRLRGSESEHMCLLARVDLVAEFAFKTQHYHLVTQSLISRSDHSCTARFRSQTN